MVVTVSTEASDSTLIAFSTRSRSSRTRSKISRAERACPTRSVSIGIIQCNGSLFASQTQPLEVGGGEGGDGVRGGAANLGELAGGFDHHGRFVAFSAVWDGGEIGRVGFDEETFGWCNAGGFADIFGCLECQDAAIAEVKTHVESLLCLGWVASETVHNARSGPVFAQDRHGVVPSFARVDGDWEIHGTSEFQLLDEYFALDFAW